MTDEELRARAESLSPTDPINIQYTSGTTGHPKGATLSHRSILNNARFVGEACAYTEEDRVCIPVPFYHCFGMVMGNLACSVFGSTIIVPSPTVDPDAVLRTLQDERCTSLYGVPTMFVAKLSHPELAAFDLSSMRTGIMAGSPCPIEVMRRVIDEMGMSQVTIAYGMTETSPVSTQTSTDDSVDHRVSTVGQIQPHVESKIIDPMTGEVVPRGEGGEYCTRGYHVMLGYWNDPEKTADAIDADGWMHSGDLATMDADGYINIVGRIKDRPEPPTVARQALRQGRPEPERAVRAPDRHDPIWGDEPSECPRRGWVDHDQAGRAPQAPLPERSADPAGARPLDQQVHRALGGYRRRAQDPSGARRLCHVQTDPRLRGLHPLSTPGPPGRQSSTAIRRSNTSTAPESSPIGGPAQRSVTSHRPAMWSLTARSWPSTSRSDSR